MESEGCKICGSLTNLCMGEILLCTECIRFLGIEECKEVACLKSYTLSNMPG